MLEPLWGNVLIRDAQNRPIYYPSVAKCRYSTVGDVYARELASASTNQVLFPHLLQAIPRAWTNLPSRPFQSCPVTTQWYNSLCLFSTSSEPVFLVCSSTRTIYSRIVEQCQETPICIAKWEKTYGNLSTSQWTLLWKTPHQCQLDTPFLRDTIWRFLHRILPTEADLHRWNLSASPHFIACTSIVPDTIDHAFDACPAWQQTLHGALNLLSAVNVSTLHLTLLHPLDLLQTRECLVHFFALLIATVWRHRKKVPPHALLASFKWQLKHHIYLQWIANKKTNFMGLLL